MTCREDRNSLRYLLLIAVATPLVTGCGGGTEDAGATARAESDAPPARQEASADFVLCPAFETVAGDVAAALGFELDAERGVQATPRECFVRGTEAEFVSIALAPAIIQSVTMQASGYEGSVAAAPELGATAVYIDAPLQPHVIFELDGRVLDLGAELSMSAPDRERMIEAALLTRDALVAANGG